MTCRVVDRHPNIRFCERTDYTFLSAITLIPLTRAQYSEIRHVKPAYFCCGNAPHLRIVNVLRRLRIDRSSTPRRAVVMAKLPFPTHAVHTWLYAAEREGLDERRLAYVCTLRDAINVMEDGPSFASAPLKLASRMPLSVAMGQ